MAEPVIQLDLNNPEFQANLLALDKPDAWAVIKTLRLLHTMSWEQLQGSKGLRWELIQSRRGPQGERLYSLRISRSCWAVAWRDGPWLRLLSLHLVTQGEATPARFRTFGGGDSQWGGLSPSPRTG